MAREPATLGVITAAGQSTRLHPIGQVVPKGFLPVGIGHGGDLDYPIRRLIRGMRSSNLKAIVVVGNGHPFFTDLARIDRSVLVTSSDSTGEWTAFKAGVEAFGGDFDVLVVASSDNVICDGELESFVQSVADADARVGVHPVTDTRRYCRVQLDDDGRTITSLVERPDGGPPGLAKTGFYAFSRSAAAHILTTRPALDCLGEYGLTESVKLLIASDYRVEPHVFAGGWVDMGTPEGLADAVALLAPSQHW